MRPLATVATAAAASRDARLCALSSYGKLRGGSSADGRAGSRGPGLRRHAPRARRKRGAAARPSFHFS